MKEYNDLYFKLINENDEIKIRSIKEFDNFLNKNKNFLSEYNIGKAYCELESSSNDIDKAYKYYKITEKYMKKYSFELMKLNINKFYEFCVTLIEIGEQKKGYKYIHKNYFNFSKEEVELFLDINFDEKNKEQFVYENI